MAIQLQDIRNRIYHDADLANSTHQSSTYVDMDINDALSEIYEAIVQVDENYFLSTDDTTMDGSETYDLPSDFFKLKAIFYVSGNDEYIVDPMNTSDMSRYRWGAQSFIQALWPTSNASFYFDLQGDTIRVAPAPGSGTLRVRYIPKLTRMTDDTDTVDSFFEDAVPARWIYGFVVPKIVAKLLARRQEMDMVPYWEGKSYQAMQTILESADDRDYSSNEQPRDVEGGSW